MFDANYCDLFLQKKKNNVICGIVNPHTDNIQKLASIMSMQT